MTQSSSQFTGERMHVDIDNPRSDLPELGFRAIWSNSNTNLEVITQQINDIATSSAEEYALTVLSGIDGTDTLYLYFVVINGDETIKPLCMMGIPSDGTINTISVQAVTTTPERGPKTPIRSRKRTKERGKARFQLLKWLQKKMKRQQINGYSNRIKNKE